MTQYLNKSFSVYANFKTDENCYACKNPAKTFYIINKEKFCKKCYENRKTIKVNEAK